MGCVRERGSQLQGRLGEGSGRLGLGLERGKAHGPAGRLAVGLWRPVRFFWANGFHTTKTEADPNYAVYANL